MRAPDVIVIGGGVIGTAVTYFLAREGLAVTLLERADLAAGASGAAAGMLAPLCEAEGRGAFFEFGLASLRAFPALAEELRARSGIDPQFEPCGILRVALTDIEAEELRAGVAAGAPFGLEWWSGADAREREPGLAPAVRGALWSPAEGHVYSPLLVRAYAVAAARLGASIEIGRVALGLVRQRGEPDRVLGVETERGELHAGHVVLCTGAWTRLCAPWLGVELPVEPVRGQILALELPQGAPRRIVWGDRAYLVPKRDGTLWVGATVERVGFDCRTTAEGVAALLEGALELLPGLRSASFRHAWAGLRPDTPDHQPAIGPVPGIEGLTLAVGHYRNGVLLSPGTGQAVADWIVRGEHSGPARAFLPDRFLAGAAGRQGTGTPSVRREEKRIP